MASDNIYNKRYKHIDYNGTTFWFGVQYADENQIGTPVACFGHIDSSGDGIGIFTVNARDMDIEREGGLTGYLISLYEIFTERLQLFLGLDKIPDTLQGELFKMIVDTVAIVNDEVVAK